MNRSELVAAVAEKAEMTKKDTDKVLSALWDTIIAKVAEGDKIQLIGFGTFEQHTRAARQGHNPRTGETMEIPEMKVPAFKAGKAFKDAVAGK